MLSGISWSVQSRCTASVNCGRISDYESFDQVESFTALTTLSVLRELVVRSNQARERRVGRSDWGKLRSKVAACRSHVLISRHSSESLVIVWLHSQTFSDTISKVISESKIKWTNCNNLVGDFLVLTRLPSSHFSQHRHSQLQQLLCFFLCLLCFLLYLLYFMLYLHCILLNLLCFLFYPVSIRHQYFILQILSL